MVTTIITVVSLILRVVGLVSAGGLGLGTLIGAALEIWLLTALWHADASELYREQRLVRRRTREGQQPVAAPGRPVVELAGVGPVRGFLGLG